MGLYDEFRFRPASWLPNSGLPLDELERIRNIRRDEMEYENENGFSVKVVLDPTLHMVQDMFYRIWTLKESFLKATGKGFAFPVRELSFSFPESRPVLRLYGQIDPSFFFFEPELFPDCRCSVCLHGSSEKQPDYPMKIKAVKSSELNFIDISSNV